MIIGITGGTGAGKTTALDVLKSFGAVIIDCDSVYNELLRTSDAMLNELRESFPRAFAESGFDRKRLGELVFADAEALHVLNNITNKYIIEQVTVMADKADISAIDAILLVESGLADKCDFTVAVIAPRDKRVQRIMQRDGISREYAELRVNAQKADEYYRANCDYILVNDSDESIFKIKCEKLFSKITGGK